MSWKQFSGINNSSINNSKQTSSIHASKVFANNVVVKQQTELGTIDISNFNFDRDTYESDTIIIKEFAKGKDISLNVIGVQNHVDSSGVVKIKKPIISSAGMFNILKSYDGSFQTLNVNSEIALKNVDSLTDGSNIVFLSDVSFNTNVEFEDICVNHFNLDSNNKIVILSDISLQNNKGLICNDVSAGAFQQHSNHILFTSDICVNGIIEANDISTHTVRVRDVSVNEIYSNNDVSINIKNDISINGNINIPEIKLNNVLCDVSIQSDLSVNNLTSYTLHIKSLNTDADIITFNGRTDLSSILINEDISTNKISTNGKYKIPTNVIIPTEIDSVTTYGLNAEAPVLVIDGDVSFNNLEADWVRTGINLVPTIEGIDTLVKNSEKYDIGSLLIVKANFKEDIYIKTAALSWYRLNILNASPFFTEFLLHKPSENTYIKTKRDNELITDNSYSSLAGIQEDDILEFYIQNTFDTCNIIYVLDISAIDPDDGDKLISIVDNSNQPYLNGANWYIDVSTTSLNNSDISTILIRPPINNGFDLSFNVTVQENRETNFIPVTRKVTFIKINEVPDWRYMILEASNYDFISNQNYDISKDASWNTEGWYGQTSLYNDQKIDNEHESDVSYTFIVRYYNPHIFNYDTSYYILDLSSIDPENFDVSYRIKTQNETYKQHDWSWNLDDSKVYIKVPGEKYSNPNDLDFSFEIISHDNIVDDVSGLVPSNYYENFFDISKRIVKFHKEMKIPNIMSLIVTPGTDSYKTILNNIGGEFKDQYVDNTYDNINYGTHIDISFLNTTYNDQSFNINLKFEKFDGYDISYLLSSAHIQKNGNTATENYSNNVRILFVDNCNLTLNVDLSGVSSDSSINGIELELDINQYSNDSKKIYLDISNEQILWDNFIKTVGTSEVDDTELLETNVVYIYKNKVSLGINALNNDGNANSYTLLKDVYFSSVNKDELFEYFSIKDISDAISDAITDGLLNQIPGDFYINVESIIETTMNANNLRIYNSYNSDGFPTTPQSQARSTHEYRSTVDVGPFHGGIDNWFYNTGTNTQINTMDISYSLFKFNMDYITHERYIHLCCYPEVIQEFRTFNVGLNLPVFRLENIDETDAMIDATSIIHQNQRFIHIRVKKTAFGARKGPEVQVTGAGRSILFNPAFDLSMDIILTRQPQRGGFGDRGWHGTWTPYSANGHSGYWCTAGIGGVGGIRANYTFLSNRETNVGTMTETVNNISTNNLSHIQDELSSDGTSYHVYKEKRINTTEYETIFNRIDDYSMNTHSSSKIARNIKKIDFEEVYYGYNLYNPSSLTNADDAETNYVMDYNIGGTTSELSANAVELSTGEQGGTGGPYIQRYPNTNSYRNQWKPNLDEGSDQKDLKRPYTLIKITGGTDTHTHKFKYMGFCQQRNYKSWGTRPESSAVVRDKWFENDFTLFSNRLSAASKPGQATTIHWDYAAQRVSGWPYHLGPFPLSRGSAANWQGSYPTCSSSNLGPNEGAPCGGGGGGDGEAAHTLDLTLLGWTELAGSTYKTLALEKGGRGGDGRHNACGGSSTAGAFTAIGSWKWGADEDGASFGNLAKFIGCLNMKDLVGQGTWPPMSSAIPQLAEEQDDIMHIRIQVPMQKEEQIYND